MAFRFLVFLVLNAGTDFPIQTSQACCSNHHFHFFLVKQFFLLLSCHILALFFIQTSDSVIRFSFERYWSSLDFLSGIVFKCCSQKMFIELLPISNLDQYLFFLRKNYQKTIKVSNHNLNSVYITTDFFLETAVL